MVKKIKRKVYSLYAKIRNSLEKPKNKWSKEKRISFLKLGYKNVHGRELNMEAPIYFTEKLQWYKVNYCTPDMERAVDKLLFKDYIKEKLGDGYTIPLLGAYDNIMALKNDWDKLPQTFVLKSTIQSDSKCIKIIKNKSEVNLKELLKELGPWFKKKNTLINSFCSAYYNAKPRIIAEEYIEQIDNQLYDYKIYCFNGKPYCLYVVSDRFNDGIKTEDKHFTFYDLNWNKLDVTLGDYTVKDIEKPVHFEQMLQIASELSKGFPFVRVDFFDIESKLYLAELTFYPGGGNRPYNPLSFDMELGELFVLP